MHDFIPVLSVLGLYITSIPIAHPRVLARNTIRSMGRNKPLEDLNMNDVMIESRFYALFWPVYLLLCKPNPKSKQDRAIDVLKRYEKVEIKNIRRSISNQEYS